jgi:acyl-coenzyme A thioesterase PaaI-like protein
MDVTQLPFNRLLGLEIVKGEQGDRVSLPAGEQYGNHLGTVHASALMAVAEAGSGDFLLCHWGDLQGLVPVVRRLEVKFRKPAQGRIFARALASAEEAANWKAEWTAKGRVLAAVPMEVTDENGVVVLTGTVEWFVAKRN